MGAMSQRELKSVRDFKLQFSKVVLMEWEGSMDLSDGKLKDLLSNIAVDKGTFSWLGKRELLQQRCLVTLLDSSLRHLDASRRHELTVIIEQTKNEYAGVDENGQPRLYMLPYGQYHLPSDFSGIFSISKYDSKPA